MNKKRNTMITLIVIGLIIFIGIIFFFLNFSKDDSSLSILEKKWITDHTNSMVDVNVYNDVPVYGYNGSGMIFDFLNYVTNEYQINFNKISYYTTSSPEFRDISFQVLEHQESLGNQDLLLFEDYYVILGNDKKEHISLESGLHLGYLEENKKILTNYFSKELELTAYDKIDKLLEALTNQEIDYIVLPNRKYMDTILKHKLSIVYHLTDLKLNYILRVKENTLYTILRKSYLDYLKTEYEKDYSKNYLNVYFDSTETTDLLRKNYNAKNYKYGYAINMPYENDVNGAFVGTISNYLEEFEKISNAEIEIIRYKSIDEVKSALVSGEIDFALGNFDYDNLNMKKYISNTMSDIHYVILSQKDHSMNSIKGLQGQKVFVVNSSKLHQLCLDNQIDTNTFLDTDELLRNTSEESIILLDKQTYLYYKNDKLKDYKINYESNIQNGYKFIMNENNHPFNDLFDYYMSSINYEQIKYLYHTNITIDKDYTFLKILGFIITLVLFLIATIFFINKRSVTNTVISKDEKLKYIDEMTSLKNRSYLNMNIYNWDDNVIFPQSVVVFDLNQLKNVNDKLGREAGDEIIKRTASILINNQLENTDIIRSGGDEFLIYMIGYDEKKVIEYMKNLTKLMKEIPNSLGVEAGYSMILDEVKTVDDAINEAILMMSKNKEKKQ